MPKTREKIWTGHSTRNNPRRTTLIKGKLEMKSGRSRTMFIKHVIEDI